VKDVHGQGLGLAAIVAMAVAGPVGAQQAAPATPLAEVVVTGSAIHTRDAGLERPVSVLTADAIQTQSALTLETLLRKIPAVGLQGLTDNQNSVGTGPGTGNENIDLRNLGAARTLVLVDGVRFPPTSNVTAEAVDIGAIPLPLIDRVEVLRDGASPIYGSDAIGGVVNVILKHDYDGAEAGGRAGVSTYGDGGEWQVWGTVGHNFSWGNLTLDVETQETDPILQKNRPWAQNEVLAIEPNGTLTTTRNPGGIAIFATPFTDPATGVSATRWVADGDGGYHKYTVADRYDLATTNGLTIGQTRTRFNLMADAHPSDAVTVYVQALYTDRISHALKDPAVLGLTPVTEKYPEGFIVPADALGNPFGESLTLSKVFTQVGDQSGETDAKTDRLLVGVKGRIGRFDWNVSYANGASYEAFTLTNAINFTHAEQEVGYVPCSAADIAAGCVLGDMFGPNALSQAAIDYLRYTAHSTAEDRLQTIDAVISGEAMRLPAGPLRVAAGATWRRLSGAFMPDVVTLAGDQQGADAQPTAGAYDVGAIFAEAKVPVLRRLPLIDELEFDLAARGSDYSDFGAKATYKASIDWKVSPDLRLRGAISTGFRAPSISELYLGKTGVGNAFNDPCDSAVGLTHLAVVAANCAAQGVPATYLQPTNNYDTLLGGNPKLNPETSRNLSAGFVLTPQVAPGLVFTADYWNIHIADAIGALNVTTILQTCYESPGLSSPLCALIGPRGALHNLTTVVDLETNNGQVRTDGVDLDLAYGFPLRRLASVLPGRLDLQADGTFTFSDLVQAGAGGPFVQLAGTVDQPTSATNPGSIPHFRGAGTATWSSGPVSLAWTVRYLGDVWALGADRSQPENHTPQVFYHDVEATLTRGKIMLSLGIDNIFNHAPPFYDDGTVNTSEYAYDVVGRYFYMSVRARL
jgi:outer membrane receptor protein involved in Fe transport